MTRPTNKQGGIAAVELALCLPLLLLLLGSATFFSFALFNYGVAAKAAHDAGRYLSSINLREMTNPADIANQVAVARAIVEQETAGLSPSPYPPSVTISCGDARCDGLSAPPTVTITIRILLVGSDLGRVTAGYIQPDLLVTASTTMRYVGL